METKYRVGIIIVFVVLMSFGILLLLSQGKDMFTNKITIVYSTGCNETYIKGVLVTPECDKSPKPYYKVEDLTWNNAPLS